MPLYRTDASIERKFSQIRNQARFNRSDSYYDRRPVLYGKTALLKLFNPYTFNCMGPKKLQTEFRLTFRTGAASARMCVVAQGVGLFGSGHVGVAKSGSSCRRCRRRSSWCRTRGDPRSRSCRRRGWRRRWICSPSHSRWKDGHAPCTRTMCQSDNRLMYTAVVVLTLAHHGHSSQVRGHRAGSSHSRVEEQPKVIIILKEVHIRQCTGRTTHAYFRMQLFSVVDGWGSEETAEK